MEPRVQHLSGAMCMHSCLFIGCTIAVKAENLNPGGSVKDRAALFLIKDAEEKGMTMPLYYNILHCIVTHCQSVITRL